MLIASAVYIALVLLCLYSTSGVDNIITTKLGKIRGVIIPYQGTHVHAYLGIPFATPPTGKYRFKRPLEAKGWEGVLNATDFPPACHQYSLSPYPWRDLLDGHSEDCLYLNVWVPSPLREGRATIFWMYTGGFAFGSNRIPVYHGQALSAHGDVIVVIPNYRVGVFGFFYSGTEEAPGNAGLYDSLLALKWVKENIEAFGGDRNMITVGGHSAGAKTAGFLSVSPLAKNLFNRVILQSGSFLKVDDSKEDNLSLAQKVAERLGCASDSLTIYNNSDIVVPCLRRVNAEDLAHATAEFKPFSSNFLIVFNDPIVGYDPKEKFKNGEYQISEVLIGNVPNEAGYSLGSMDRDTFGFFGLKNTLFNKSYGDTILRKLVFSKVRDKTKAIDYYLGNLKDTDLEEIRQRVIDAYSDFRFICPCVYYAEKLSDKKVNVFYYLMTRRPSVEKWAPWMGVVHSSENQYLFGQPTLNPESYTQEEHSLSIQMMQLWTNFAKTGYPDDEWPLYDRKHRKVKILNDAEVRKIESDEPHMPACNFLRQYFPDITEEQ